MRKKRIENYPAYEIYDDGKVFSHKSHKFLKAVKNDSGYGTVNLYNGKADGRRSCSIHQLVAENFIKNPNNYKEVNHIDGNKDNNYYKNLEWCTRNYNQNHAYEQELNHKQRAVRCITNGQVYRSCSEAERQLNCDHRMISACCAGKRHKHHGMKFEYV